MFKGILYDQGLESSHRHQLPMREQGCTAGGNASSIEIQQLNTSSSSAADPAGAAASSRGAAAHSQVATFLDPSFYHSASLNSFMAGTQFFPPPRT